MTRGRWAETGWQGRMRMSMGSSDVGVEQMSIWTWPRLHCSMPLRLGCIKEAKSLIFASYKMDSIWFLLVSFHSLCSLCGPRLAVCCLLGDLPNQIDCPIDCYLYCLVVSGNGIDKSKFIVGISLGLHFRWWKKRLMYRAIWRKRRCFRFDC